MKKMSLSCLCAVLLQLALGQQNSNPIKPAVPVFVTSVEGVKEYRLANGLQILLVPDPAQTNVIVNIVYHVGSRLEGYGETGMAHLLEHMLFKGSKKFSNIKQTIADKGAFANGTTDYDRTDYFEILPSTDSNLNWALDMEADRMVNSLMRNEDLQKEFTVVRNEFESGENYPDNILEERIVSTMYLWHNYGKAVIGSKQDIERVPIGNLKKFYEKYYQPDNATLVIGGKFDEKKTLSLITNYFANIPKPTRIIEQPYTVEPPQDGERYVELRRNGDVPYIGMAYHTPSYSDKDYAANSAIVNILTNDPSGIFYKALVDTRLATKVWGYSQVLYDPGFTYFGCTVPQGKNLDSAKNGFINTADSLPFDNITQADLDRAKNSIAKRIANMQDNMLYFCTSIAEPIGAGDWRLFFVYRDRVENLTLAEVQAALRKYYLPSNRTLGVFIPDKDAQRVTVSERPDVNNLLQNYIGKVDKGQIETFDASIENIKKNTQYGTLSNGLKYALLKKPAKGDKIYGRFILKIGDEKSLTGTNIIPQLTARMLRNGTTTKSKKDINDLLDKIKTYINIYGYAGTINIYLETDKDNLSAALDVLADMILHPSFDNHEYDKMVLDMKGEFQANLSDPQSVASDAINKKTSLYPKGHPYYPASANENLENLQNATLNDVKKFYANFYGVGNASVAFAGNIDQQAIKSFLEKSLGNFSAKQPYAEIEDKYFDVKASLETIAIPDKTNAVCLGNINIPLKETDSDFVALDMANEMLGGGTFISSRIAKRLRELEGMSYGAGSYLNSDYKYAASSWGLNAIFNPLYKKRLDSALHDEINKALQTGFNADEFKKSVSSWLQQRTTYLGLDNFIASELASYLDDGKDISYYTQYNIRVEKLTLSQVNAALRRYINPDKLTLIYAGDFSKNK